MPGGRYARLEVGSGRSDEVAPVVTQPPMPRKNFSRFRRKQPMSGGKLPGWTGNAHAESRGGAGPQTGPEGRVASPHHAVSVPRAADSGTRQAREGLPGGGAFHRPDGGRRAAGAGRPLARGILQPRRRQHPVRRGSAGGGGAQIRIVLPTRGGFGPWLALP